MGREVYLDRPGLAARERGCDPVLRFRHRDPDDQLLPERHAVERLGVGEPGTAQNAEVEGGFPTQDAVGKRICPIAPRFETSGRAVRKRVAPSHLPDSIFAARFDPRQYPNTAGLARKHTGSGTPRQNALIEPFNASLRNDLPNDEILDTLDDALPEPGAPALGLQRRQVALIDRKLTPLQARRRLQEFKGSTPGALAQNDRSGCHSQTLRFAL
jgi:hypothetical protein